MTFLYQSKAPKSHSVFSLERSKRVHVLCVFSNPRRKSPKTITDGDGMLVKSGLVAVRTPYFRETGPASYPQSPSHRTDSNAGDAGNRDGELCGHCSRAGQMLLRTRAQGTERPHLAAPTMTDTQELFVRNRVDGKQKRDETRVFEVLLASPDKMIGEIEGRSRGYSFTPSQSRIIPSESRFQVVNSGIQGISRKPSSVAAATRSGNSLRKPSGFLLLLAAFLLPIVPGAAIDPGNGPVRVPIAVAEAVRVASADGGGAMERVTGLTGVGRVGRGGPGRKLGGSKKGSGSTSGGDGGGSGSTKKVDEPESVAALVIGGNFTLNGKSTNVAQYDPVR